ncbi:MAG: NAD(P)H-dependent oxidoreductase [Prolixibacteraceae bacterium]
MQQFLNGYHDHTHTNPPLHYLADTTKNSEHLQAAQQADQLIIIFPLYTDAMPGQVKFFFESLAQINMKGKTIGFVVQSGFPEAYHSIFVERYLAKLAKRLECHYLGTVIKGGVEGIKIMPSSMTKKLYANFFELGKYFADSGMFNKQIVKELRNPYRMSVVRRGVFKIMLATGLANFYWNSKLKEHNAYKMRYAQPYAE